MRSKGLVIVESPAKARTIGKILGRGYEVCASRGHVRDLPAGELGVDVDAGFEPRYEVIRGQRRTLASLKLRARAAGTTYLATDPDREGEALAWHLVETLDLPLERTVRIRFGEITPEAIRDALEHPSAIDMGRVHAQQARRVLDRLLGYEAGEHLRSRLGRRLSAGRVQTPALGMIVERERRIAARPRRETFDVIAELEAYAVARRGATRRIRLRAKLVRLDGAPFRPRGGSSVRAVLERLGTPRCLRADRTLRRVETIPAPPPFRTSTLIEEAADRFGFHASMTMALAQDLFQGMEIGTQGPVGLITYPRTDATRIAPHALEAARDLIAARFGRRYLPARPRTHRPPPGAQGAHEAIRPTRVDRLPEDVRPHLGGDHARLYDLIWRRFLASRMAPAQVVRTEVHLALPPPPAVACFRAQTLRVRFPGFRRIHPFPDPGPADATSIQAPGEALDEGAILGVVSLAPRPRPLPGPHRFTQASLVRALERAGIGRPSTYAPVLAILEERGYVELRSSELHPTALGARVVEEVAGRYPDLVRDRFTAEIEARLDRIESGAADYRSVVESVWARVDPADS